ncbi:phage holin family protein [Streptococcus infantis]|uniref:phage holin family protein n=1 Tax=Streptococcus infantis TaxID=68892 RepID=UPI0020C9232A|nr:phage holin family protein [Streptococcus infantis]MCP9057436.1 phage holin family protein [Streptococcus infantis]MCP9080907.1 phage holin family protein [Streptococcus infantis]
MQDLAFHELAEHLKNLSYSPYIHFFFWLMVLDIATGYIKAFKTKRFDSKVGTMGLIRHFIVFVVILLVAMYARSLGFRSFGIAWTMFFSFNYLFSVIENWEMIGLAFPEFLKPYINQIKKDNARKIGQLLVNIDQKDKIEVEVKEKEDDATNQ